MRTNSLINQQVYNLCKADNISDQGAKLDADVQHKLASCYINTFTLTTVLNITAF